MYLKGSKWSMQHRRRRSNPLFISFLVLMILGLVYVDRIVVPTIPPLFVPTSTPTRSPESYIVEAETYSAEGKMSQAIASYKEAILVDPKNASNYLALARLQVLDGDYTDAISNAENALLLNQNNPLAHAVRGWALGLQDDPNYLDAEASLQQALTLDPNNALAHAYLAEVLGREDEDGAGNLSTLDEAIEESRTARDLDPDLLEVHRARGYIHMLVGEYDEAITEYEEATAINDNIADLHLSLGQAYAAIDDNDSAIIEYNRAYSLNSSDPMASYLISRVQAKIGEWAQAVQYAEQAVKSDPANPTMLGNLGSMYYKDGQYEQAVKYLSLAIRGGTTEDGLVVEGIPFDSTTRTLEFFNRYGLALARTNRCSDAIQISAMIKQGVPDDEDSVYNADQMIVICQENLEATATPDGTEINGSGDGETMDEVTVEEEEATPVP